MPCNANEQDNYKKTNIPYMKELKASGSLGGKEYYDSPESLIIPYEDMNVRQEKITGERLPDSILQLCDNCLWSCMCFNPRGLITKCPICSTEISQIPMKIDETCSIEFSNKRGITLGFDRKSPIR
jgi:hypothetical protein